MKTNYLSFAATCLLAISTTACSNSLTQFLNNVDVSVSQQNNDQYVNLTAVVNLGNVSVSGISIPVTDPNSGKNLGMVTLGQNSSGQSTIGLSLDATTISKGNATLGSTLPNSKALPFALATTYGDVMAVPILQNSRVYIGGDLQTNIIIGVALGISGLDGIESQVGGAANLFFSHAFSTTITGMGGIYGSTIPGESGIAVFARYTPPVLTTSPITITSTSPTTGATTSTAPTNDGATTITGGTNTSSPIAIKSAGARLLTATATSPSSKSAVAAVAPDAQQMDEVSYRSNQKILKYFYGKRKVLKVH